MWLIKFTRFCCGLMVGIGLFLLLWPDEHLPAFYHPLFFSVIALFSPLLTLLPPYFLKPESPRQERLTSTVQAITAFSLLVNILGELGLYQLFRFGFEYDKFAHFFVCMLFSFITCEILKEWKHLSFGKITQRVILLFLLAGIAWEGLEATADFLFKTQSWGVYGKYLVSDTYQDLAYNMLGALAGLLVFATPPRIKNKDLLSGPSLAQSD